MPGAAFASALLWRQDRRDGEKSRSSPRGCGLELPGMMCLFSSPLNPSLRPFPSHDHSSFLFLSPFPLHSSYGVRIGEERGRGMEGKMKRKEKWGGFISYT